jgi:hypothetical protein
MNRFGEIHNSIGLDHAVLFAEKRAEVPNENHVPTLEEIRRRACKIHRDHGSVSGGYTLDDWLEAEHELDDKSSVVPQKKQVH